MRQLVLSAAVVLACTATAWGQYPPSVPGGYGYPAGAVPMPGFPPGYVPLGENGMPDYLPPITMPPGVPPMPPANSNATANMDGFAFDPCFPDQRSPQPRVHQESWIRGDWLYGTLRNAPIPALIVTGNPAQPGAGIPGSGNVRSLVGPVQDFGSFHGARATLGRWFDPDGELGVELSGFVFEHKGSTAQFQGSPTQPLSVPIIGTNGQVGVYDFSFPNRFAGTLGIRAATVLWGADANALHRIWGNGWMSVDGILGFRYLELNERLDLVGQAQSTGAIATLRGVRLPNGTIVSTLDSFRARTDFMGGQIGARFEARRSMFTITAYGKAGAGANIQTLRVEGMTQASAFGITRTAIGGVRALPSNFGRDTNTDFSMTGETGIELGLQVTKNLSLRAGYNALWWSDVLRPGNAISPVATLPSVPIDPTFNARVQPTNPVNTFRSSDYLAHALVVGILLEW